MNVVVKVLGMMNPRFRDEFESIYGLKVAELGEDHPHLNLAVKRKCLNFLRDEKKRSHAEIVSMPASRNYLDADIETILDLCLDDREKEVVLAFARGDRKIDGLTSRMCYLIIERIKGRYDFRARLEDDRERNSETVRRHFATGKEDAPGEGSTPGYYDYARTSRTCCAA